MFFMRRGDKNSVAYVIGVHGMLHWGRSEKVGMRAKEVSYKLEKRCHVGGGQLRGAGRIPGGRLALCIGAGREIGGWFFFGKLRNLKSVRGRR